MYFYGEFRLYRITIRSPSWASKFTILEIIWSSLSPVQSSGVLAEPLNKWKSIQFPPPQSHIHSCVACPKQIDLAEPILHQFKSQTMISNLKTCLGHGHMTIDLIEGTPTVTFSQRSPPAIINALAAYITIERSLYHSSLVFKRGVHLLSV